MSREDKDEKVGTTAERPLVPVRLLGFVKDENVGSATSSCGSCRRLE
jgi:hypothetical protein